MLPAATQIYSNKTKCFFFFIRNEFNSHRIGFTNVATVLLFWRSNMAAKTSCENALFVLLVILHTQCIGMAHLFNGYCVGVWLSGLGLSSGWGHCAVFLGKTLCSHSASLLYTLIPAKLLGRSYKMPGEGV